MCRRRRIDVVPEGDGFVVSAGFRDHSWEPDGAEAIVHEYELEASLLVDGGVTVPYVVLNGIVKGDVFAGKRVELGPTARVIGNVYYNLIEMAIGAEINGRLVHQPEGQVPLLEKSNQEPESPVQMASAN